MLSACKQMLASVIRYLFIPCIVVFVIEQFITDVFADDGIPVLVPIENYRDFISFGADALRPDAANNRTSGYTGLLFVDAVAARGNDIFIADTSQRTIFHIDRTRRSISKFAFLRGGGATDLYVAADFSVYVVDQLQRRVIQYARDGRRLRIFENKLELFNPVAVVESEQLNRVLIADSLTGHIAVFNKLGGLSRIISPYINIPGWTGALTDMVSNNGHIYLLDKLARKVSIIDFAGRYLYSLGSSQLRQPVAMAIDKCQRIFVADQFNNSIHVYYDNDPLVVFDNIAGVGGLELATDIWIDHDILYIAGGTSGNVKVLRIEGGCL